MNQSIKLKLNNSQSSVPFLVEMEAFEGVKRIAKKVATDVEKVCGKKPEIIDNFQENKIPEIAVIIATLDKSPIIERFINEGKFDISEIQGKREVYKIQILESNAQKIITICGSDKRGTIYGAFALSQYIGVSPLHYWGDVEPLKKEIIEIGSDIEIVSKEPSVRYRGFFINDEWPCFGNWTFSHFDGFTSKMYDNVFELLLRLNGNYLWPAMWSSSFPLDGPGNLNEELADIYGVVMGYSHHEPCLRASEEWDKVRGKDSIYGNEWNYYTNRDGLLKYWEDALKRSGKYENIITIGMRGERDSSMLGPDASVKQNIDLLKDIITNQRELIKNHVNPDLDEVPQMLALYKEVEEYFYGSEEEEGLKDWHGLDGVTCMLCEDNFGYMRTLPTEEMRNRNGGFGMYYHFDYHGGPVSYEWMPSTPLQKVWEQMGRAYDYGIRDIWIVNVGDLKFNEVGLAYFLTLAYDFEKWGSSSPNSIEEYYKIWFEKTFPAIDEKTRKKMSEVFEKFVRINSMRRPESLNSKIYHPCNYLEADRMLKLAAELEKDNEEIYISLSNVEKDAYYSMIYFPAKSSINLLRMQIYAGKNAHYAGQFKPAANRFADLVSECIKEDRRLMEEFAVFKDGKWKGMELEQHIGFTRWNDENYKYPLRTLVEPVHKPRMIVSRKDSEKTAIRNYKPMTINVDDFMYEGNTEVVLEIANEGIGNLEFFIETDKDKKCEWLTISPVRGTVETQEEIILTCDRSKLSEETESTRIMIKDKETTIAVAVRGKTTNLKELPPMTFLENNEVITIEANHFCSKRDTERGSFVILENYGRSGCGVKVFPAIESFKETDSDRPSLTYRFKSEEAGDYNVEIWTAPTSPPQFKQPLRFTLTCSNENNKVVEILSSSYRAGDFRDPQWSDGVMRNIRVTKTSINCEQGVQEIIIGALEAGFVLERILIFRNSKNLKPSYLGPKESFYTS